MKILVSCVPYDGGKSGISVCIREQTAALRAAGHDITLILEHSAAKDFDGYKKIVLPKFADKPLFSMLFHLFVLPFLIRGKGFDFCLLCAANRRTFAYYPCPTLAVVHDLSQYHVKAKYDAFRMFYIRRVLPFFVRRADIVVAISRSTKSDLVKYWGIPDSKIRLVYNGLSLPAVPDEPLGTRWRNRIGLKRPYLLYISRLETPGKNHIGLIRAFNMLPRDLAEKYDIVMAGAKWEGSQPIFDEAAKSPYADHFIFPGFIDASEMHEAYGAAAGYVFPSLFEGFGLSLIEAMHYGVPCACSSTSSLGELGEGCAVLFNPENVGEISAALRKLLTDSDGNKLRIQAGKARAASFSWTKNAAQIAALGEELCADKRKIFGVKIDAVSMDEALRKIDSAIARARETDKCAEFSFVNAHCLNVARSDAEYARILNSCDAVFPDGSGVKIAGKILGFGVPENVNGTDMFEHLCRSGHSLFLLGAAEGIAEKAMRNVKLKYPQAVILGAECGYFANAEAEREIVSKINSANPDLLLVAMGVPKQEKWIAAHSGKLRCGAAMGVGGLFDFASGRIPRAPAFLRKIGLEWTYRLYQEPRRLFKRYIFGNPKFLLSVILSKFKKTNS